MAIKARSINGQGDYTDYKHLKSNYNTSNISNYSHLVNIPTNFNLKSIFFEDIDMAIYREFNRAFKINSKDMPLIILDADLISLQKQNYEQFDSDKQFLNLPFFTMYRTNSVKVRRTNPGFKQVLYTEPKMKANGIVYEEYISEGPIDWELYYQFQFVTNYREYTNQMEQQMGYYFRNKRNMINLDNDRFVIGPQSQDTLGQLEIINREDVEQRTLYVTTYNLKVWCYTRDLSNMQKRERPNTFLLDIVLKDSVGTTSSSDTITMVERYELDNTDYPTHPVQ